MTDTDCRIRQSRKDLSERVSLLIVVIRPRRRLAIHIHGIRLLQAVRGGVPRGCGRANAVRHDDCRLLRGCGSRPCRE